MRSVVGVAGELGGALEVLRRVGVPAALGERDGGDGLPAHGVEGDAVGDGLCVDEVGVVVEVVDVVAGLVVVDVVGDAGLAAKEGGLGLGLDALGAREEPAGRDAVLDEGGVVGAPVELGGHVAAAPRLEELLKVLLDDVGARGAREAEGAAVAVVDGQDGVRAGNHVEVEVGADLGHLLVGAVELLDVKVRAELAVLLGAPEPEADGVLGRELGEGLGDHEDTDGTGAVIAEREREKNHRVVDLLDTGSGKDGVGVASNHQDVVVVSATRLGDDVVVDAVLDDGDDVEVDRDLLARGEGGGVGQPRVAGDAHDGGVRVGGGAEGPGEGPDVVVVDDGGDGAGGLCVGGLDGEVAAASRHERHGAGDVGGEIGGLAAEVGGGDEGRPGHVAGGRVGHGAGVDGGAGDAEGRLGAGEALGEGLLVDVEVVELLELLDQPVDGGVVAAAAKGAVALVRVGHVLQLLGAGEQVLDRDELLKLLGLDVGLALDGAGQRGQRQSQHGGSHLGRRFNNFLTKGIWDEPDMRSKVCQDG
ncbi:hypothetical protein CTA1_1339 [Colletotrichum tanaceti]|uniref:Uncharacterized protein n=1 Tax=Colletotrichum tanaceti TaxID=1306861 RepID=A0A4U6X293_9PEZI|nr:hypothetical protein CTA1_1339 [Colletotrichum tanaceti]